MSQEHNGQWKALDCFCWLFHLDPAKPRAEMSEVLDSSAQHHPQSSWDNIYWINRLFNAWLNSCSLPALLPASACWAVVRAWLGQGRRRPSSLSSYLNHMLLCLCFRMFFPWLETTIWSKFSSNSPGAPPSYRPHTCHSPVFERPCNKIVGFPSCRSFPSLVDQLFLPILPLYGKHWEEL